MTHQGVLRRDDISEFASQMYEGDLHAKRVLSLSNATLGVLTSASLAIHVGRSRSGPGDALSKHGRFKQVDRLLSNEGIDVERFFGNWVRARPEIVETGPVELRARPGMRRSILLSMLHRARAGDRR